MRRLQAPDSFPAQCGDKARIHARQGKLDIDVGNHASSLAGQVMHNESKDEIDLIVPSMDDKSG